VIESIVTIKLFHCYLFSQSMLLIYDLRHSQSPLYDEKLSNNFWKISSFLKHQTNPKEKSCLAVENLNISGIRLLLEPTSLKINING